MAYLGLRRCVIINSRSDSHQRTGRQGEGHPRDVSQGSPGFQAYTASSAKEVPVRSPLSVPTWPEETAQYFPSTTAQQYCVELVCVARRRACRCVVAVAPMSALAFLVSVC